MKNVTWPFPPKNPEQKITPIDVIYDRVNCALDKENLNAAMNILNRRKDALKKREAVRV